MVTRRPAPRARAARLALLALALAACGGEPRTTAAEADDHTVFTTTFDEALTGVASGAWGTPAVAYGTVAVDPKYRHVLGFRVTPMMPPWREAEPSHGPLVLYSDDLEVLVLSPMDHFQASLVDLVDGRLRYGLVGDVEEVPAGFTHRFLLVEGRGLRATLERWGDLMRADRGRERVDRYADRGLAYLGYWTDNGAAYYYKTEGDLNAEDTLLAVRDRFAALGVPLGYLQLDSWWYEKEPGGVFGPGGLVRWEPLADRFPSGLEAFREALGLPLVLHNRWFARDNAYRDDFAFYDDEEMSLPLERGVYDLFMADAVRWGAFTYEQDWLTPQYHGVRWLRSGVDHGARWLGWIDEAARDAGLTTQITMASAAHLMEALDRPSVTSVRTSIDYIPNVSKESFWPQFHIVNLVAWAIGVPVFKDNFRSMEEQGEAEALISALSAGMVGPSDALDEVDPVLLRRSCRADGLLLKPDRPALPLDAMFLPHRRPYTVATSSTVAGVGTWWYVAAFHLASRHPDWTGEDEFFSVINYDGEPMDKMFVWPEAVDDWRLDPAAELGASGPLVAYDWRTGEARAVEGAFDLPRRAALYDHAYVVLAPVLPGGLALLGEVDKLVPLADRRFTAVTPRDGGVDVVLAGVPGEEVTLRAFDAEAGAMLPDVTVTVGADGAATARLAR